MVQSVRVLGFLPEVNGLHFGNNWSSGIPDYTFNILGQTLMLGDAGNGLCGGMVFTVKDLFETGLLPPTDPVDPAGGSQLFNYIVARLTNSFNEDNVNQYLSWIQMSDHDTAIAHGLAWHEISEEWPKIKADLDSNHVSPLGLVYGQEPSSVGFFTGIQDLKNCHVVLAWGYDLDGSDLTIYIYDPDYPGDDTHTITLSIADPEHTTPITVFAGPAGPYRGFFQNHYTYHDPRTPASAAFIETVVSSPGIISAGPIQPTWVDRVLIESSGAPLVRFTGSVHDWSSQIPTSGSGEEIVQLRTVITTGSDDLRGGNGPNDNCDVIITFASGASITIQNINNGFHWNNGKTHTVILPLPTGTHVGDIIEFTLHTQFDGGIGGDNWNVNQVSLVASILPVTSGGLPQVTLSQTNINFGSVSLGDIRTQTVTLTNTGSGPLVISATSVSGANPSDFDLSQNNCTDATLIPGMSCTVDVSFSPPAAGIRGAELEFIDTASDSPQHIGLKGQGIKPSVVH